VLVICLIIIVVTCLRRKSDLPLNNPTTMEMQARQIPNVSNEVSISDIAFRDITKERNTHGIEDAEFAQTTSRLKIELCS